jgi:UrcA family protein
MIGTKLSGAAFVGLVSAFTLCGSAAAEPPMIVEAQPNVRQASVSYADLNLASGKGRKALEVRVRRAAAQLCIPQGTEQIWFKMEGKRCFNEALAGARPQVEQAVAGFNTPLYAGRKTIEVALRK